MVRTHQPESRRRIARLGAVVFGADAEVAQWVGRSIPGYIASPDAKALGVVKGGQLVAGVVFERWNGVHVEASIVARPRSRWADRRTLFALFHYPFVTLGCRAISVTVPGSNLLSLNLSTKLGFEPKAIIPFAAHDGGPLIVLQQYRETCRWIGDHGERRKSTRGP